MDHSNESKPMSHGGARRGAGRKPGWRNLGVRAAIGDGLSPLEYLLEVMRDESLDGNRRTEAAKAAAPFCHPKR